MPDVALALDRLLASKEIIIACGPGGVGKTTTAAALAAAAATHQSVKVLVLTVDPARRLADALGLEGLANNETQIDPAMFAAAGVRPKGELWAAMLDSSVSWDALMRRYAHDQASAEAILANPFYRNITSRFAHSHEYIAMERLYELHTSGAYDLLVIDTPPSRSALDFLDAPQHMAEFFSSRLLRWLTTPARSRVLGLASRPFYQIADRVLGTQLLENIGAFLALFEGMYPGFVERSNAVAALLRDARTSFMVISTLEPGPFEEARRLLGDLDRRGFSVGLLVANKVLGASFSAGRGEAIATVLEEKGALLGQQLSQSDPQSYPDPAQLARVLGEIGQSFRNFYLVASREAELFDELASAHQSRVLVPQLMTDVVDLAGLIEIGERLFTADRPG